MKIAQIVKLSDRSFNGNKSVAFKYKKINKVNIPEENKEKMKLKFLKLEKFCA